MRDRILTDGIVYADESTTQILKELNKGVQAKKYMALSAGDSPEEFVYYYPYHSSHLHEVAAQFLEDFNGFLHGDGYVAYDSLAAK
jgi:transposase